jgi:hypothetical protein
MTLYKASTFGVPKSDLVIHVEADGRTVWASDKSGRQLWRGDPFETAGMKPYRYRRPVINFIGPLPKRDAKVCGGRGRPLAALGYNSTQFGCLDASTGHFVFLGQD